MAQNYSQFSEFIVCDNQGQIDWLLTNLKSIEEGCSFEKDNEDGQDGVWIYDEEGGADLYAVCQVLQKFLVTFAPEQTFTISVAHYCSKMRVAEFDGEAWFVSRYNIKRISAREDVRELGVVITYVS